MSSRDQVDGSTVTQTILKRLLAFGLLPLVLLASASGTASGQIKDPPIPSFSRQDITADRGAKGIVAADFNGDGVLDLLTTNLGAGTVTLFAGFGDGVEIPRQFRHEATVNVGREPRGLVVDDFDGDGLVDFAVTNFAVADLGDSTVTVAFQVQAPDPGPPEFKVRAIQVEGGPSDVVAADFNQDGILDLAVANIFSDRISVILGQANQEFAPPQSLSAAEGPQSIAAGDLDRDGNLDLVTGNLYSDDITVFLGDGAGGFEPTAPIPPPTFPFRKFAHDDSAVDLALDDLNGDGNLDAAFVNSTRPRVDLRFGDGAGGFSEAGSLPVAAQPRAVVVADVNADGRNDIAALGTASDEVSLQLGVGAGLFAGPFNYSVGDRPQDLAVGNFDLDPGLDLFATFADSVSVLASGGGSPPVIVAVGPTQGPLSGGTVLLIDGENFTAGASVTIGGTPVTTFEPLPTNRIKLVVPPGAAGPADITVTTPDGSDTVVGIFNYTAGPIPELDLRYMRLVFCDAETGDSLPDLDPCRINSTKDSTPGDFDNDGQLDIYAAKTTDHGDHGGGSANHGHPGSINDDEVYFNVGSAGPEVIGSFVDDLGVTRDVLLATRRFDVTPGVVTNDPIPKVQYDIQSADLDDDGDLDVVTMSTDRLRILINDGSGTFTDETATRILGFTSNIAFQWDDVDIGDLDGDGDLDVIGAPRFDHGIGPPQLPILLLNDGPPGFTFTANFSLLESAALDAGLVAKYASHDVDLADIDNDGDLDVIFSGTETNEDPRIFANSLAGTGTLGFEVVYPTDPTRLDPVPNTGINHVAASRRFGPGDAPDPLNKRLLKPLDFNGDGFVDLYFGSEDTDQIYINRGGASAGFFTRLQNVPFPLGYTYGGSVGDLDLDGRIDIIEADYYGEPMIYLNRIPVGTAIDDLNASSQAPFIAIPEPMRIVATGELGSRRDGLVRGSYWQAVTDATVGGLDEPDVNKDTGLTPGSKTGFLSYFTQILDVDLGDFDSDGDLDIIFSLGDHQNRANRIFLSNANLPPVADAGPDQTLECTSPGGALVMLDGTGSSDPNGDPLTFSWVAPGITFDDPTSATPSATFPLGTTTVTLTVTDPGGLGDSDTVSVTVEDTTPPAVTIAADPSSLWPPNHRYRTISLSITAEDLCDPTLMVTAVAQSSEADDANGQGDGRTIGDIKVTTSGGGVVLSSNAAPQVAFDPVLDQLDLRAERTGQGPGRTYSITVTATDGSGNSTTATVIVSVPHHRR